MTAAERAERLAQRAALIERLRSMPTAMRDKPQWLVWKFVEKRGAAKPSKVPFYACGHLRGWPNGKPTDGKPTEAQPQVPQGADLDRAALVTLDAALAALQKNQALAGVGFAFLPGDGLIGVDVDAAIDPDTGEVAAHCLSIIEQCASYTELSPSGKGVHIIVSGETTTFSDDAVGVEVYCGRQFFTCTGEHWSGSPSDVRPIQPEALAYLRQLVDDSRARTAALKAAEVATAPAAAAPRSSSRPASVPAGDNDFQRVNAAALQRLDAWVPVLFPSARPHVSPKGPGYRVRSKDLGRNLEEDLTFTPEGIHDFGLREGKSAIDLAVEWRGMSVRDALHWLAPMVGVSLTKPARKLKLVPPPARDQPAGPTEQGFDSRPEPPPLPPRGGGDGAPPRARSGGRGAAPSESSGDGLGRLLTNFRLVYGTGAVWDGEQRVTMEVKNLRLLFGADVVKRWLAHPDRLVVMQHHMVFEPGQEVPDDHVNLFDGLPLEPIECTEAEVKPMLDLLRHLCGESADTAEGVDAVIDWVLKWLAFPLQHVGAKLRTSLVFHGPQGTGKNLFFDCIRAMYGKYGRMVGQTELDDKFNDWLSAKLLIIGNEVVTRQELFHNKNKLKWIVTEDEIPIRGMHQTVRWESNHAQVIFISNEHQPVALEKDDRRHLVVYTPVGADNDLYLIVADFLRRGGAARFLHYLLRYDTDDFHEHTKPLMTKAKEMLIELGLKPAERFIEEWLRGYLTLPVQVCSAEQLYRVFRRWADMNGERWPPPQAQFTTTVQRHVKERVARDPSTGEREEPRLAYKVCTLKDEVGARRSVRCWLPRGTGPLNGVSEGEWAAASVDAFEVQVSRYGRTSAHEEPES